MNSFSTLVLTINSILFLGLSVLVYHINRDTNTVHLTVTKIGKKWISICIKIGKKYMAIPLRSYERVKLKEDIRELKNSSKERQTQQLRTMISWKNTEAEVLKFKKTYQSINPELVRMIVQSRLRTIREEIRNKEK